MLPMGDQTSYSVVGSTKGISMRNNWKRFGVRVICAGTCLLVVAAVTLAERVGVVTTNTGQVFEGSVTEKDDRVSVVIRGIETVVPRDQVASIDYTTYADRFAKALAAIEADDVAGRVELARQAFDRREYDLAQQAVTSAREVSPLDRDAIELEVLIGKQRVLDEQRDTRPEPVAPAPSLTGPTREGRPTKAVTLDEDQINQLRLAELKPGDSRLKVAFRKNVKRRYADTRADLDFREFNALTEAEQALAILANGTPDMIADVRVMSDPPAISTYVRSINTPLVQGCATSQCHGGGNAGKFRLLAQSADPATAHTNFYIVATYSTVVQGRDVGIFGSPLQRMVDRGSPSDSLLVQFALPAAKARYPHPVVKGYNGTIKDINDPFAQTLIRWMQRDLKSVAPDYPFNFSIETAPATLPAQ